jgi:hypothetical protein
VGNVNLLMVNALFDDKKHLSLPEGVATTRKGFLKKYLSSRDLP